MIEAGGVLNIVANGIVKNGMPVRLKFYTSSYSGADYDVGYLTAVSGTGQWVIGLVQPIGGGRQGEEAKFLEEGVLKVDDRKIFLVGSITFPTQTLKIGVGSPITDEYSVLPEGRVTQNISGVTIYHKLYCRRLANGSFGNE